MQDDATLLLLRGRIGYTSYAELVLEGCAGDEGGEASACKDKMVSVMIWAVQSGGAQCAEVE